MRLLIAAVLACAWHPVHATPIEDVIRAQLAPALPPDTDIVKVHLPAKLARLDVTASEVASEITIELPRELRVGRRSIKLAVRGAHAVYVPVTIGALVDVAIAKRALPVGTVITADDVRIETRAIDGATPLGAAVLGARVTRPIAADGVFEPSSVALPPPLPRGTQVTVEIRRGSVRIRGTGTLELVARVGEDATVRLAQTKTTLRGTLVAPGTVVVKGIP